MAKIRIVEVGLRDGLQNEATNVSVADRLELARRLCGAGVAQLEVGAFVSPTWVPQMAGSAEVVRGVYQMQKLGQISRKAQFTALVPNERGMRDALEAGVREISIFAACSETFAKKNTNCTIAESFARFAPVLKLASQHRVKVRGYLSVCFGCPYEGPVPEARVVKIARQMVALGVYEISIGDTIGVANPKQVRSLTKKLRKVIPIKKLAMHFHDTRGTALANILASLDLGICTYDSSVGGLGGCPYAPGALGNVATEDVVYMLHGMGHDTGLKLDQLIEADRWIATKVGHELPSRVAKVRPWPSRL